MYKLINIEILVICSFFLLLIIMYAALCVKCN